MEQITNTRRQANNDGAQKIKGKQKTTWKRGESSKTAETLKKDKIQELETHQHGEKTEMPG